ncbi:MAG: winged helix-turn-helix transcriptional regulator [Clostridiales bacterium]|nr:winged helix-turn-helix transcriptional regulator [Clostridiales bacterium]
MTMVRTRHRLPSDELLCDLADLFKIFGDTTRLKIMCALLEGGMKVNDIAESLGMTQSAISHQLKTLKDANLVTGSRDGKNIVYSLSDDHVSTIIAQGFDHVTEESGEGHEGHSHQHRH